MRTDLEGVVLLFLGGAMAFLLAVAGLHLYTNVTEGTIQGGTVIAHSHTDGYPITMSDNSMIWQDDTWEVVVKGYRSKSHRLDTDSYEVDHSTYLHYQIGSIYP